MNNLFFQIWKSSLWKSDCQWKLQHTNTCSLHFFVRADSKWTSIWVIRCWVITTGMNAISQTIQRTLYFGWAILTWHFHWDLKWVSKFLTFITRSKPANGDSGSAFYDLNFQVQVYTQLYTIIICVIAYKTIKYGCQCCVILIELSCVLFCCFYKFDFYFHKMLALPRLNVS